MALRFYWRCESTTLDGTHDYTIGDDSTATAGNSCVLDATAAKVGSYGILGDDSNRTMTFACSSGTPPTPTSVGSVGFWIHWTGSALTTGLCQGYRNVGSNSLNRIEVHSVSGGNLRLRIGSVTPGNQDWDLSSGVLSIGNWYFIIIRWDQPNSKRAIEIYDVDGTRLNTGDAENTNAFTAPTELAGAGGLVWGNMSSRAAATGSTWVDNCFIADTYNEPLLENRNITSYTQYGQTGSPLILPHRSGGGFIDLQGNFRG